MTLAGFRSTRQMCLVLQGVLRASFLAGFAVLDAGCPRFGVYVLAYTCICVYTCTFACTYMYLHMYTHADHHKRHWGRKRAWPTYTSACIHTYIHTYMHACMHACTHIVTRDTRDVIVDDPLRYSSIYIHTYLHTSCMHPYIHAHTHAYIHTLRSSQATVGTSWQTTSACNTQVARQSSTKNGSTAGLRLSTREQLTAYAWCIHTT
jgi:hypothetical protein